MNKERWKERMKEIIKTKKWKSVCPCYLMNIVLKNWMLCLDYKVLHRSSQKTNLQMLQSRYEN